MTVTDLQRAAQNLLNCTCSCFSGRILSTRIKPTTVKSAIHTTTKCSYPRNPARGASAMRRKPYPGRVSLRFDQMDLPKPVTDPSKHTKIVTDPGHGLWGFFNEAKASIPTPDEDHKHGRAWSVEELRRKSWGDLHKLWWICVKERNIMATQQLERERLKPGFGEAEATQRARLVRDTQRAIKHALTERYYAWQEALKVAEKDEEVDLSGQGPAFVSKAFEEPQIDKDETDEANDMDTENGDDVPQPKGYLDSNDRTSERKMGSSPGSDGDRHISSTSSMSTMLPKFGSSNLSKSASSNESEPLTSDRGDGKGSENVQRL